ncbi:MAG: 4-hydroxybenzoate octaprenyltransferase [Alphaproteobacteria bacterium]
MDDTLNTKTLNNKEHTDIKKTVWIEKTIPQQLKPYAYAIRLDRPIGIWLLLLPGLWGIALASGGLKNIDAKTLYISTLFFLGAITMRAAGCIINDLWDRDIDQKVKRTKSRPIASGTIGTKQALTLLLFLLATGLAILMQLNTTTITLGIISLPLIIVYPLMKRITWWPQAFLGLTFNLGTLMGWSAITGSLAAPAWVLYIGGIVWTLGYDTIYAHQDITDDLKIGIKSTALRFGSNSKKWVTGFFVLHIAAISLALYISPKGITLYTTALLALLSAHFIWQLYKWKPEDQESSLHIFRANKNAGMLTLLACL